MLLCCLCPAASAQNASLASAHPLFAGPDLLPGLVEPGTPASSLPAVTSEQLAESQPCIFDSARRPQPWEIFHRQQVELQIMSGITYFPIGLGPDGPPSIFLPQQVRLGFVLNNTRPDCLIRGTFEAIAELDTVPIVQGAGSILTGGALYGRYNLSCRDLRLVPYFEIGGGGAYSDAYRFHPTNLSTGFEFILHMGLGTRLLLTDRWALSTEWAFYHFSNGGMHMPNLGINTWGVTLGVSRFLN
jgi:hypothetical protein